SWHLLVLSAKTRSALDEATRNLAAHLDQHPALDLGDVAYTLQRGRRPFRHRRAVVCRDLEDARRTLEGGAPARRFERTIEGAAQGVAFLFPGQGAQHPNMGRDLYRTEKVFRVEVDRGAELLRRDLGFDLREVLYPSEGDEADAGRRLDETAAAQPALFVVEHALAR